MSFDRLISWAAVRTIKPKERSDGQQVFPGSERRIIYPDRKEGFHSRPGVQVKLPMCVLALRGRPAIQTRTILWPTSCLNCADSV